VYSVSLQGSYQACMKRHIFMSATIFLLLLASIPARAHKVNVFAYVEGDRVIVEGYFSGKAKARDCRVEVFDGTAKKVNEGRTDQEGIYAFRLGDLPTFSGGLKVVVDTGDGHKAEYVLAASDLPTASKAVQAPTDTGERAETPAESAAPVSGPPSGATPPATATPAVDKAALEAALESALDKKLEPIIRSIGKLEKTLLEEQRQGPKPSEVIGGIGWIMGLVGLAAFFYSRNRSPR
ncbi:MAG: hypothetical protein V2B18_25440, partial [Pseudomonadota bacterium]